MTSAPLDEFFARQSSVRKMIPFLHACRRELCETEEDYNGIFLGMQDKL